MRKRGQYPREVKAGSATVKVYRIRHKTTASGWVYTVAWGTPQGRKTSQFADESDAMEEARIKAAQLAHGRVEGADMSRGDRDELLAARTIAGDVPVLAALEEWSKARAVAGGNLLAAAEAWAARQGAGVEVISIGQVVKRFLDAKTKAGVDVGNSYRPCQHWRSSLSGESQSAAGAPRPLAWQQRGGSGGFARGGDRAAIRP